MANAPTNGMIRPALELAWAVAKAGSQARPAVAPAGRLRPLMGFARLPNQALSTVRQVIDEDDEFRARVAAIAEEDGLGPAAWLWLVRPEGWEEDLGALVEAADAAALEVQAEREERSARRRLAAAEGAKARAEGELVRLRQANAALLAEVSSERQARRHAEAQLHGIEVASRTADNQHGQMRQTVAELEARVALLAQQVDEANRLAAATGRERDAARAEVEQLRTDLESAGGENARLTETRQRTRDAVGPALSRAAAAAGQLSEALADVARSVGGDDGTDDVAAPVGPVAAVPSAGAGPVRVGRAAPRPAAARRRPVALPLAVFDDSFEAADYLVRVAGVLLIVDGYNVTISSWPHLELPRQRHRLVDALAELAVRVGPAVHVVFDGTDSGGRFGPPAAARRRMRVSFSPEGVDADQIIVDLVDHLDTAQPVVVATDDREVRDEVRRRGANVISVAQLLAVIGRAPGSAAG